MMEGKKQTLQDASIIDDMYSLLAAYEVKIPTNDQVKLDDLHEVVGKYEDSIEAADLFIERHKNAQMADLDKQVNLISEELMTILGTLHSGKFLIPESDPAEVVADLTKINERIQEIVETVDRYKGYQKLFQVYYTMIFFIQSFIHTLKISIHIPCKRLMKVTLWANPSVGMMVLLFCYLIIHEINVNIYPHLKYLFFKKNLDFKILNSRFFIYCNFLKNK